MLLLLRIGHHFLLLLRLLLTLVVLPLTLLLLSLLFPAPLPLPLLLPAPACSPLTQVAHSRHATAHIRPWRCTQQQQQRQ
jgi:hypothetical protein